MSLIYRKCPKCNHLNLNRDYCEKCGTLVNTELQRAVQRQKKILEDQKKLADKKPNPVSRFFENLRNHSNIVVRSIGYFFYYTWIIIIVVSSFLAYLIGYIAA